MYPSTIARAIAHWRPFLLACALTACGSIAQPSAPYHVALRVSGMERAYTFSGAQTVADLLQRAEVSLSEGDWLSHAPDEPLIDGMVVEARLQAEWSECVLHPLPFETREQPNELLRPGESRAGPAGIPGSEEVCTFFQIRSGQTSQQVISREIIATPRAQIHFIGSEWAPADLPITGAIAYLSHGSVWIMRGSSGARQPISKAADGDGRVFALAPSGDALLYSRQLREDEANQLWLLRSTQELSVPALQLAARDVMTADWHGPDRQSIYLAQNGEAPTLWRQRLNLDSGQLQYEEIAHPRLAARPRSHFAPNHAGSAIAYAQPGELGIYHFASNEIRALARYPAQYEDGRLWLPPLAWTADDRFLYTTLPAPTETEAERFDLVVFASDGQFRATLAEDVGRRARALPAPNATAPLAYTRHRENGYSLYITDRDGSNARKLFPANDSGSDEQLRDFAWSPAGAQLLVNLAGNLWLIAADSGEARQLTGDGGVSALAWGP